MYPWATYIYQTSCDWTLIKTNIPAKFIMAWTKGVDFIRVQLAPAINIYLSDWMQFEQFSWSSSCGIICLKFVLKV